jgi:quercetin dioxygenase-like cupin family protein
MEPLIRNINDNTDSPGRLVTLDQNPPTCTLSYSKYDDGETSPHHIHEWEHEVYIISGKGTLFCDGIEYPVQAGDGLFIPPNVDHYTLNNGKDGFLSRIEVNPLIAAQSGGSTKQGGGTGAAPTIRHHSALEAGNVLIGSPEGALNYVMLYNGAMKPGSVSHEETGGHVHPWEHVVYILEGEGIINCEGTDYKVVAGDGILVPQNSHHQWRNESSTPLLRVTFNPIESENKD